MRHTIQAWTLANPSRRAPGAKLRAAVRRSPKEANQLLQRFPGIGEPGADKILLFAGGQVSLGPDSNALRVLYRLGFGKQEKRSEEHTSELQSRLHLVCRLLLEKKKESNKSAPRKSKQNTAQSSRRLGQ